MTDQIPLPFGIDAPASLTVAHLEGRVSLEQLRRSGLVAPPASTAVPPEPRVPPDPVRYNGETFEQERDGSRLAEQHRRVAAVMRGEGWHTLAEIADRTGDPEASVSARLRDFRKVRFGGYTVERRYLRDGLFEYRVLSPKSPQVVHTDVDGSSASDGEG